MFTQTLQRLQHNLNILQEREAKYAGDAPLALLNQIDDHIATITLTEQAQRREISEAEWREALRPLLVAIEKRTGEAAAINISDISNSVITIQGSVMANIQAGGDVVAGDKIETHNYYQSPLAPAPASGRCDYYAHINLPPNFVPRPELLAAVKQTLLATEENIALTSAIKMSALHGMGGIGKSVLARALCDDQAVQEHFSDGILWTTLGQEVTEDDLKTKLRVWIETLGGVVSATAPTLSQLKNTLAGQLKGRSCLLVVDDMWRYPDAAWFNGGGPACRLLLTTRDAEAARQLGAAIAPVSIMTESEAITLLERWAGRSLSQRDPVPVARIVQRLGYLPLALKLAGEQLRRKGPEQWLAGFSAQKLKSRRDETVHGNLFDTFALSLSELPAEEQQLYASLVIFKEDEPIPSQAIAMLWSQLGNYDPDDSEALLFDLADRALLLLDADQAMILHDLVRDFVAGHLLEGGPFWAHAALLAGYRITQSSEGWPTAPDDGYLYGHLAYHLDALAAQDETAAAQLKQLFVDDRWLRARVPADDYRYDGYLADLELAWQRVEGAIRAQIEAGQPPAAVGELVHHALIQTSINSLAGQYHPALVARAVETGLWSVARGLSLATKIADYKSQAEMCRHLLLVDSLQPTQRRQLSQIGLRSALAIGLEWFRAEVLTGLASRLSGEAKVQALAEALGAALAIGNEGLRTEALSGLAPQLSGGLLAEALGAALAIGDEGARAKVLTGLAPQLSGELLAEALGAALAIGNEGLRTEALSGLAPQLSGELLSEALGAALAIGDEWRRAKALIGLAPQLSGELLVEALGTALAIGDEGSRAEALTGLAPQLSGELLAEALGAALAIGNERSRAKALAGLAPQLSGELLEAALEAALAIGDERDRTSALAGLAPQLSRELKAQALAEALGAALAIDNEWSRAKVLTSLAPQLSGEAKAQALAEALGAALAIGDERSRAKVLTGLAPQLSGEAKARALAKALRAALAIGYERSRSRSNFQVAGASKCGSGRHRNARPTSNLDLLSRAEILTGLAPHLSGEAKAQVLIEALKAALAIDREWSQAKVLTGLAPQLSGDLLAEALEAALAFGDEGYRTEVLTSLAPQLSGELLAEALQAALTIGDERFQAKALTGLASYMRDEAKVQALAEALQTARAIDDEASRVEILAGLTQYLSGAAKEQILAEALEAASVIDNEWYWAKAKALTCLAPRLNEEEKAQVLAEVLRTVLVIDLEWFRSEVLIGLAPHLSGVLVAEVLQAALAISSEWHRAEILASLAPQLSGKLLTEALRAVLAIGSELLLAKALNGLAPQLSGELLVEALRAALALDDEWPRAYALTGLAPQLNGESLAEALGAALAIGDEGPRAYALTGLASQLNGETKEQALVEALRAALDISHEVSRANALTGLAPHLSGETKAQVLAETLRTALTIDYAWHRAEVLTDLAPLLSEEKRAKALTEALIAELGSLRQAKRGYLLDLIGTTKLFDPEKLGLPAETLAAISRSIIEVCTQWRWL